MLAPQTQSPAIDFVVTGPDDLKKKLGKDKRFKKTIEELLNVFFEQLPPERRKMQRSFTLAARRTVKGTTHTKGLRIRLPESSGSGVVFTWHEGSNDNCIEVVFCTPKLIYPNCMDFHSALKRAQDECIRRKAQRNDNNGNGRRDEVVNAKPAETTAVDVRPQEPADAAATPPFVLDDDATELVLIQAFEIGNVQSDGLVPRRKVMEALAKRGCGVLQRSEVFALLIERGHFVAVDDKPDMLLLGKEWRVKFLKEKPDTTGEEDRTPEHEHMGMGGTRGPGSSRRKAMSALPNIQRLLKSAERSTEIRAELKKLEAKRGPAQRRLDAIVSKISKLNLELEGVAKDEVQLRELEQKLGGTK